MRFALDGLPRDMPLTLEQRRDLRRRVRAWRPPEGLWRHAWIGLIPGAIGFTAMAIWMPALWNLPRTLGVLTAGVVITGQTILTFWAMPRAFWKWRWRALAACGYPVCYRCAYPLNEVHAPTCPECGHPLPQHAAPDSTLKNASMSWSVPVSPSLLKSASPQVPQHAPARHVKNASMS